MENKMKNLIYIKREDFIKVFLSLESHCKVCSMVEYFETVNGNTVTLNWITSLRTATVSCGRYTLCIGYTGWPKYRGISVTYRSNKNDGEIKKLAIVNLPIRRFNKALVASGCNLRITA